MTLNVRAGVLGRKILDQSLPMLSQLLEARTMQLQQLLESNMAGTPQFIQVSEDVHWLVMISGHILSMGVVTGETNLIPQPITLFCRSNEANVSMDATLRYATF